MCVLPAPGRPVSSDEPPRPHQLDHAPLLLGNVELRSARPGKQLGRGGAGAGSERPGEPTLHLPQRGAVGAVALEHELAPEHEPAQRRLERLDIVHLEQPPGALPELIQRQERIPVRLRLLEHKAQARVQPLRRVRLDPERARDPVGHLEADPRHLGQAIRVLAQHRDHLEAVAAHQPRRQPGADPVGKQERLHLADRRHLTPGHDSPLDGVARDRTPCPRAYLAQPLRVTVELNEHTLRTEMLNDRPRERRADPGHAAPQPQRDTLRRLRQRQTEALDRELPPVTRVPLEPADDHQLLAPGHLPERPAQRHRLALPLLTHRRRPDRELAIARNPTRPDPASLTASSRASRSTGHRSTLSIHTQARLLARHDPPSSSANNTPETLAFDSLSGAPNSVSPADSRVRQPEPSLCTPHASYHAEARWTTAAVLSGAYAASTGAATCGSAGAGATGGSMHSAAQRMIVARLRAHRSP